MIDCTKPVKHKVIYSSSYVDAGYKRHTTNSEEWVECAIELINGTDYGRVKTDVKQWKDFTKDKYRTGYEEIGNEQSLYDLVDLKTGYVMARTFKSDLKEAIKIYQDFKYVDNGKYQCVTWEAELNSRMQYVQEND